MINSNKLKNDSQSAMINMRREDKHLTDQMSHRATLFGQYAKTATAGGPLLSAVDHRGQFGYPPVKYVQIPKNPTLRQCMGHILRICKMARCHSNVTVISIVNFILHITKKEKLTYELVVAATYIIIKRDHDFPPNMTSILSLFDSSMNEKLISIEREIFLDYFINWVEQPNYGMELYKRLGIDVFDIDVECIISRTLINCDIDEEQEYLRVKEYSYFVSQLAGNYCFTKSPDLQQLQISNPSININIPVTGGRFSPWASNKSRVNISSKGGFLVEGIVAEDPEDDDSDLECDPEYE